MSFKPHSELPTMIPRYMFLRRNLAIVLLTVMSPATVRALSSVHHPSLKPSRGNYPQHSKNEKTFMGNRDTNTARSMLRSFGGAPDVSTWSRNPSSIPQDPTVTLEAFATGFDSSIIVDATNHQLPQQQQQGASFQSLWFPVLSSALLITGNTFGAGSLVLPKLAAGPGLGVSAAVFGVAYGVNLLSGLTLASVAITQRENSVATESGQTSEIPASFQEFVQANLQSPELAVLMSGVSFAINSLVLAFDISRVGLMFQGADLDPMLINAMWSAALVALVATQTQERVSQVASLCVIALFASFGTLLIPGLASLTNPLADWLSAPGTAANDPSMFWNSLGELTPVVVMCTTFQNIVPTTVKFLNYDRMKSYLAILLGSFLPLAMYIAWCWACLGQGGIDLEATLGVLGNNPFLTIFALASLAGSSIGCSLSCASEMDIFIKKRGKTTLEEHNEQEFDNERFQLPSVLATVGLPFGLNAFCAHGGDLTSALHVAGGLGSPILYGTIPVLMALKQTRKEEGTNSFGILGLGVLGAASTGMLCGNIADLVTATIPGVFTSVAQAVPI